MSSSTKQLTFVMWVDTVDRIKLWVDSIVKLHFAHTNNPLDDVFYKHFFRHIAGRHYVHCCQCCIKC